MHRIIVARVFLGLAALACGPALAEFSAEGQLTDLRCGPSPLLAPHFDDIEACGFSGDVSNAVLYSAKGQPRMRLAYQRGERRRSEALWDDGSVRNLQETGKPRDLVEYLSDGGRSLRRETGYDDNGRKAFGK